MKKNVKISYCFLIAIIFFASQSIFFAQGKTENNKNNQPNPLPREIFIEVEKGLLNSNVSLFFPFVGGQVYLSLSNGVNGYFSANQVFHVLQDYLRVFRPSSFRFYTIKDDTGNPYATGIYLYESKGVRGSSQVFISLNLFGDNWKITQITIN